MEQKDVDPALYPETVSLRDLRRLFREEGLGDEAFQTLLFKLYRRSSKTDELARKRVTDMIRRIEMEPAKGFVPS